MYLGAGKPRLPFFSVFFSWPCKKVLFKKNPYFCGVLCAGGVLRVELSRRKAARPPWPVCCWCPQVVLPFHAVGPTFMYEWHFISATAFGSLVQYRSMYMSMPYRVVSNVCRLSSSFPRK